MLTEGWRIQLLGDLRILRNDHEVKRFRTKKFGLLLAYLAHYGQRSHAREELAALFWPDADTEAGRLNLRVALSSLRKQLEPPGVPAGSVLLTEKEAVRLHPNAFQTDVQIFETALVAAERTTEWTALRDHLLVAIEAYQGCFLPGFYDDWVSLEQTRLEERYRQALHRLIEIFEQADDPVQALNYALRAIRVDPLDEIGYQFAIRLYLRNGQHAAAWRQFQELERKLATDLGVKPSPATRRLLETVECADAPATSSNRASRLRPVATAPSPAPATSAQRKPAFCLLPPALNRFFGRERELAMLQEQLAEAGNRLISLVGTAGAGKTRLAIEAVRRFIDDGAGAGAFVSLAVTTNPQQIPELILGALRLPPKEKTPPLEQVIAFLDKTSAAEAARVVLVLDNLEHLLAADAMQTVEIVQELIRRVSGLTLLTTSRHPLLIDGEALLPLTSLPFPVLPGTPERLREFAGIQLFVDRAQAAQPDFQITPRNIAAITELCRRLDGLPLAIELAAAWAQTLTPAQMVQRLENRFQMLVSRKRDSASRHRSLHAAIASSYSLLSAEAQRLFCLISVFRGGFTLEAVTEVARGVEGDTGNLLPVEDLLAILQEHSLLTVERHEETLRFSLLESLREFARDQLSREARFAAALAHANWCRDLTQRASVASPQDQPAWKDVLLQEQENVRGALEFCFQAPPTEIDTEQLSPERRPDLLGMHIAAALPWYWQWRGAYAEGVRWLEEAVRRSDTGRPDPWTEDLRFHLAGLTFFLGLYAEAESHCRTSLDRWQEEWDPVLKGRVLSRLGQVYGIQRDYARAEPLLQEGLAVFKSACEWSRASDALNGLGIIAKNRGDYVQARRYLEEGLGYDRRGNDTRQIYVKLVNLSVIAIAQKEYSLAESQLAESLVMVRERGDRPGIALILHNLALVTEEQSPERALGYLHESMTIRSEIQDRHGIILNLNLLGDILQRRDALRAVRFYAFARMMMETTGTREAFANPQRVDAFVEELRITESEAEVVWQLGRVASPAAAIQEALQFCAERGKVVSGPLKEPSALPG